MAVLKEIERHFGKDIAKLDAEDVDEIEKLNQEWYYVPPVRIFRFYIPVQVVARQKNCALRKVIFILTRIKLLKTTCADTPWWSRQLGTAFQLWDSVSVCYMWARLQHSFITDGGGAQDLEQSRCTTNFVLAWITTEIVQNFDLLFGPCQFVMAVSGRLFTNGLSCRWGRLPIALSSVVKQLRVPCSQLHNGSPLATTTSSYGYWEPGQFNPKKAVILTKVSRWGHFSSTI